jgi:hypothetical protein
MLTGTPPETATHVRLQAIMKRRSRSPTEAGRKLVLSLPQLWRLSLTLTAGLGSVAQYARDDARHAVVRYLEDVRTREGIHMPIGQHRKPRRRWSPVAFLAIGLLLTAGGVGAARLMPDAVAMSGPPPTVAGQTAVPGEAVPGDAFPSDPMPSASASPGDSPVPSPAAADSSRDPATLPGVAPRQSVPTRRPPAATASPKRRAPVPTTPAPAPAPTSPAPAPTAPASSPSGTPVPHSSASAATTASRGS